MSVRVRPAEPAEYAEAGRVAVEGYRKHGHLGDPENGYAARLADAAGRARDCDLLVAVDAAGRVVGTVSYMEYGTPLAEVCDEGEAEFRMLAVDPAAERGGVGAALVRACLDRARERGRTAVTICARSDVADSALRLYARLGFTRVPEKDWSPVDGVPLIGLRHALSG